MAHDEAEYYRSLLDNIHDGVYVVDRDRKITFWNKGCERISGFTALEAVGKSCAEDLLMHVDDGGIRQCAVGQCLAARAMNEGTVCEGDVNLHHKAGHRVPVSIRVTPIRASDGLITGAVQVFFERYDKIALQERIRQLEGLALLDELTGVGNRRFARSRLIAYCNELKRLNLPFGVLLCDIDNFKTVNDTHGHQAGDKLLRMVANTLALNTRSFDHVARWGGDEFLIVVLNVELPNLAVVADKLCRLVSASSLTLPSGPMHVTVSIGGTLATKEDLPDTLVARADRMLYASKHAGRNTITTG